VVGAPAAAGCAPGLRNVSSPEVGDRSWVAEWQAGNFDGVMVVASDDRQRESAEAAIRVLVVAGCV